MCTELGLRQQSTEARVVLQMVEVRRVTNHGLGIAGCHRLAKKFQRLIRVSKVVVENSGTKQDIGVRRRDLERPRYSSRAGCS